MDYYIIISSISNGYSCFSAIMGLTFAAFIAGYRPKIIPTAMLMLP